MAASSNKPNKPEADPIAESAKAHEHVVVTSIPEEDIADVVAAHEVPVNPEDFRAARERLNGGTIRETNTEYEDRTVHPAEDLDREFEVEAKELPSGSILVTYGEPVGGFPKAE